MKSDNESQRRPSRAAGLWRALKMALFLAFVASVGLSAGVAWAVFDLLGGMKALPAIPGVLRDPGRLAFGDSTRMNILFLGIDYNHDSKGMLYTKHARSDTIFVVSLDHKARGFSIVSIPRDMRVEIPGHGADKINTAYSYKANGDVALSRRTVEGFLGIRIDHVVVIKPYAAEHLVDALGGVTLEVEKDMDYDDNWGNLHIHLKKGRQHLDGKQAVGYIRFRKDAEGDRGRIRRQQQFMNTLLSQLPRFENLGRLGQVRSAIEKDIETDLGCEELIDLAMLYKSFDRKQMRSGRVEGNDTLIDDTFYLVADEAQKRKVTQLLGASAEEPRKPADIRIEVFNGCRVAGAASRVAELLKQQGYQVVRVGNADTIPTTQLVDRLNDPTATGAVRTLVGSTAEVQRDDSPGDADITIVLGENFSLAGGQGPGDGDRAAQ